MGNGKNKSYIAQIKTNGSEIFIGAFKTPEEAAQAYNNAALKYHGEYAWLNRIGFPGEKAIDS